MQLLHAVTTSDRAGHDPDFVAAPENLARAWCAGLGQGLRP